MEELNINEMMAHIKRNKRQGDVKDVCLALGCTTQVFWNAISRTDGNYTTMEILVIKGLYNKSVEQAELRRSVGLNVALCSAN